MATIDTTKQIKDAGEVLKQAIDQHHQAEAKTKADVAKAKVDEAVTTAVNSAVSAGQATVTSAPTPTAVQAPVAVKEPTPVPSPSPAPIAAPAASTSVLGHTAVASPATATQPRVILPASSPTPTPDRTGWFVAAALVLGGIVYAILRYKHLVI